VRALGRLAVDASRDLLEHFGAETERVFGAQAAILRRRDALLRRPVAAGPAGEGTVGVPFARLAARSGAGSSRTGDETLDLLRCFPLVIGRSVWRPTPIVQNGTPLLIHTGGVKRHP